MDDNLSSYAPYETGTPSGRSARFSHKQLAHTRRPSAVAVRPFLKWAGGKSQLLAVIRASYPLGLGTTITRYAEPFVGGGAVLLDVLSRAHLQAVYISDTNRELINAYTVVRDSVHALIAMLSQLESEFLARDVDERRHYYYDRRREFNATAIGRSQRSDVRKAALLVFLNRTCFNGLYRVNRNNEFNVPMGQYKNPRICDAVNLTAAASLLGGVTIVCGDYHECERFVNENTFVYIDPPYRPLTKTASFTAYTQDSFDDNAQIELAGFVDLLADRKHARVLVSNSDPRNSDPTDDFFDKLYARYTIRRVHAARMINSKVSGRGSVAELLISTYQQ